MGGVLERAWVRWLLISISLPVFALAVLWPAGQWDWLLGWAYIGLNTGALAASRIYLGYRNPDVLTSRRRIGKGTKKWDMVWLPCMRIMYLGTLVLAGFDAVRWGWTSMPTSLWPVGLVIFLIGALTTIRAMGENPHFEGTVRIQTDRGHRIIDTGPYSIVRHPGYVGLALAILGTPLLLGSWWALLPAGATAAWIVVRTALEDRTLQRELEGYTAYATRVRYRLVPSLW